MSIMGETVTLEIPADLASQARATAAATNRRFEDVVAEWLGRGATEISIESMPDQEVIALCDITLSPASQDELSELLFLNRETALGDAQRDRLNQLMASYRSGLLRKAKAWQEAVARGLKAPFTDDVA